MAIGTSGRIVLEIDPTVKKEIYAALDREGRSLKDWFLEVVQAQLLQRDQLRLAFSEDNPTDKARYEKKK